MSAQPDGATGTVHRLGPLDQVPVGEGRAFAAGGRMVAVVRQRSGRLHAVEAVCPHRGGPIADGQVDETVVVCPLHLNAFDLTTGCSTTGAPPLEVFPVSVDDDGTILVTVPDEPAAAARDLARAADGGADSTFASLQPLPR